MPRRGEKDAGGSSLSLLGLRFALSNDRGLAPRRRAIVRAKSPLVPTKPLARRRGVLGRRSRFTTALQPPNPRRGACARKVPTWRLNCRCPSARRGGVGVEVRGASSQRWLCRVPPVGVGVVRCVSPTAASGTFHPAPPSACALLASPLCRACPLRLSGRSRS